MLEKSDVLVRRSKAEMLLYRIKHFSPAWFGMVMGTGISSAILVNYPFGAEWLRDIGIAFWAFATGLLIVFCIMSVLRHVLFPGTFKQVLLHPMQSMFLGCMPMGLSSVIADTIGIFGKSAVWPCYILWWIDLALSLACAWLLVFVGFVHHRRKEPAGLNAVILLPVVTLVVNSSTGSLIVEHLPDSWKPHMIVMTTLVWGNGEILAYAFTCVYCWRLLTGNMPAREMMISCFLPIGPLGQGAYGFLLNSQNLETYLVKHGYPILVQIPVFTYAGVIVAVVMVGFATFWLFCAVAGCLYYRPKRFGVSWWGLSFPVGTYALATNELGKVLDADSFRVVSCIVGSTVVLASFSLCIATFYFSVLRDNVFRNLEMEMEEFYPKPTALRDESDSV
ncbi:voltage-dependent anion channel [Lipomyces tetrasporus]|uniref:Voltage-dependent anion channel n=1 Tax=Lipomyces tetrasporus TaxID=54092 RepID=A0AAD7VVQ9_9ASCO|nr:voltage-dependent anion channel [Lipomyces tetrasporus]KAJ8103763.1 voltage-dependent anion channel [Lipomyces tetrasporus]